MASIGDVFLRILADANGFEADVVRKAGPGADKAGATLGGRMSKGMRGALGAGIGAGLGMALSGANQLDAATRQLQADTGMTADEAAAAEHALAGMYQHNLQGFDQIGAAMAKVHNDLGLVGKAADDASAKALKFGTATGQDAAEGVTRLDDIMDNWGLTADHMGEVMDKLILSHQRWGGSIADNEVTLAKLAPAMTAANFTIDDGISLLGLFGAKGLDSERAAAAFSKALTKVKSPAELKALIKDIQNTKDPFERATKAADLFGAKAGAQLANALGGANLDDYAISMNDAAGATDRAAAAVESGFSNRFKLIMKNASGALADFGTNFGDVAMLAAAFGPGLTKAIGAGLGGLSGVLIPKVTAAVLATGPGAALAGSGVGTAIGTAMGAAIPIALAAAAGVGIALAVKSIFLDPGLQQQTKAIGTAVGEQIISGTLAELQQSKAALERGIADINALPLGGFLYGDQVRDLQTQLDAVNAKIAESAAEIPTTIANEVAAGTSKVEVAVADLVATFGVSMAGVKKAARVTGADGMLAMAAGITAARAKPLDAFDTLKEMLKHAMTATQEVARLGGELTSKALAKGLKSKDPAVRAQALAVKQAIIDRLTELAEAGGPAGKKAMDKLNAGIKSKDPEIRAAALAAKTTVETELNGIKAEDAAKKAAAAFAAYWTSKEGKAKIYGAIHTITAGIQTILGGGTPKPSSGGGGPHAIPAATGITYVPYDNMPALLHKREAVLTAPEADVWRAGQSASVLGSGTSATTVNNNVNVTGLVRARSPIEIATQLRRFGEMGLLSPKAVPG